MAQLRIGGYGLRYKFKDVTKGGGGTNHYQKCKRRGPIWKFGERTLSRSVKKYLQPRKSQKKIGEKEGGDLKKKQDMFKPKKKGGRERIKRAHIEGVCLEESDREDFCSRNEKMAQGGGSPEVNKQRCIQ